MGLPNPTLSFTIPSLHDDLAIQCRIYHPHPSSRNHPIVIAHPYAPLGGCFDDPVVGTVGNEFLKMGWVVATFNFRGAGGGHTSWTGRAEGRDYESVVGVLVGYIGGLRAFGGEDKGESRGRAAEKERSAEKTSERTVHLILAGYSYGSLITTHLPPTPQILSRFANPAEGTAAAEIWARHGSHGHNCDDGDEDQIGDEEDKDTPQKEEKKIDGFGTEVRVKSYYLLVSPLLPPISSLATMALWSVFSSSSLSVSASKKHDDPFQKMRENPSFAVFGDHDSFTSIKKLRHWATRLEEESGGLFGFAIAEGGGHFWREEGAVSVLREGLKGWVDKHFKDNMDDK
ncbi:hypothetical protein K402DRAFT_410453 [Aulographum hederae CBS 113979]|uniref:Alpha/beta-hydrolase n=1 Tax=Aulographum hederae CBS 113979 TaxID=1176131 RepID=A0A6G1HB52_9PEZI|nr:hypothetical protein K402DRAFT_410453 [Aulographum hederae CBS 113979]